MKEEGVEETDKQRAERMFAELWEVTQAEAKRRGVDVEEVRYPRIPDMGALYVHDNGTEQAPGCIVGHWLHYKHDVELPALVAWEAEPAGEVVRDLGPWGELSPFMEKAIDLVQRRQDAGLSWAHAIRKAEEWAEQQVDVAEA